MRNRQQKQVLSSSEAGCQIWSKSGSDWRQTKWDKYESFLRSYFSTFWLEIWPTLGPNMSPLSDVTGSKHLHTVTRFRPKVGQIGPKWDKSVNFQIRLTEPKCRPYLIWSEKFPDLSHLGPIWLNLGSNLVTVPRNINTCRRAPTIKYRIYSINLSVSVSIPLSVAADVRSTRADNCRLCPYVTVSSVLLVKIYLHFNLLSNN